MLAEAPGARVEDPARHAGLSNQEIHMTVILALVAVCGMLAVVRDLNRPYY